jgi:predicted small lipoprotein YifL
MHDTRTVFRASAATLALLVLAGCGGQFGGLSLPGSGGGPAPPPAGAPSVNMAGKWLLSEPSRGQCVMTFGAASTAAGAAVGTIAPEGGCPGKFFTSRKWTYELGNLVMRDHNGQPLAELTETGGHFEGKATTGEPVTLGR